ncbi:MAG: hypothetical protein ACYDCG_18750 [Candidatus Acidiferrales bacterium]
MKADRYLSVALSVLFCMLGTHLLLDAIRHAQSHADEYVLIGATLTALGLAILVIAFEQYRGVRAMAQHMRRGSHLSRRSRAAKTEGHS